jgi:hypothetical protein
MDEHVRKVTELELRREAAGLSRPKLGIDLELRSEDGVRVTPRTLRRWEERSHEPSPVMQEGLCEYFDVGSTAKLGLGHGPTAARHWTWMTEEERREEVDRRQVNSLLGKGAAAGATACVLPVSTLTAAAQILDGRPRLGTADLATVTRVANDIASSYEATPTAEVVRAARAHAYTLLDRLDHASMSDTTRARLTAIVADTASLVGYGHLHAGRLAQADAWFTKALKLARQAGDRRLEALVLGAFGQVLLYGPEPDHAAAAAAFQAAAELQRFLPPAGRTWVFGMLSQERAALHDGLASGRFLEHARVAAARVQGDEPGSGCWSTHGHLSGWDGVRLDVFAGTRYQLLGRPAEAVRLGEARSTA